MIKAKRTVHLLKIDSIKFHLILLVVLISIPFCVILISAVKNQRDNTLDNVNGETKGLVLSLSSQQEGLMAGAQQLFKALAQVEDVQRSKKTPRLNRLL